MAQIKKEQLKRIINKEFAYVIKEAEKKDIYFNQIAREYVINTLTKEGILEEGWQDRAVQKQMAQGGRGGRRGPTSTYGETFQGLRKRAGFGDHPVPPQFGQSSPWLGEPEDEPEDERAFAADDEPEDEPVPAPAGAPGPGPAGAPAPAGAGDWTPDPHAFAPPPQYTDQIDKLASGATAALKGSIPSIGAGVYAKLKEELPAKTGMQVSDIALLIMQTVTDLFGKTQNYEVAAGVEPASAGDIPELPPEDVQNVTLPPGITPAQAGWSGYGGLARAVGTSPLYK